MIKIPVIPMIRILKQYAEGKGLPLNTRNWESIVRTFYTYNSDAKFLN